MTAPPRALSWPSSVSRDPDCRGNNWTALRKSSRKHARKPGDELSDHFDDSRNTTATCRSLWPGVPAKILRSGAALYVIGGSHLCCADSVAGSDSAGMGDRLGTINV